MSKKIEAAAKLREAMSELKVAMKKSSSPSEKKDIAASMTEIRSFYKTLTAADEPEEQTSTEVSDEDLDEALADELDLPQSTLEELGFEDSDEDALLASAALDLAAKALTATRPSGFKTSTDEDFARAALELAASALSAADEEEEEEEEEEAGDKPVDDFNEDELPEDTAEGADDEPMDDVSDDSSDDGMADDDMAMDSSDELPLTEFENESDDIDYGSDDELPDPALLLEDVSPMPESTDPESDFDVAEETSEVPSEAVEEDTSGYLTEEDLIALEHEGLMTPDMLDLLEDAIEEKEEGHSVTDLDVDEAIGDDGEVESEIGVGEEPDEVEESTEVEAEDDEVEAEDEVEPTIEAKMRATALRLRAMADGKNKKPVSPAKVRANASFRLDSGALCKIVMSPIKKRPVIILVTEGEEEANWDYEDESELPALNAEIKNAKSVEEAVEILGVDVSASASTIAVPELIETNDDEDLDFSAYTELMSSYSPEERKEILGSVVSAFTKKLSPSDLKRIQRDEAKNRKKRKKRGPVLRSKKGKMASVVLPGGKRKTIKKKYYFTTLDSKGKKMGQHWMATRRPSRKAVEAYKNKHGVPHPFALPVDSKATKAAKERKKQ